MSVILFGEDLELDTLAWELRRGGRSVRLERIPMEILLLLIDRRSELVSREQIAAKVWGPDVFVDVDNSINVAIRKLRTTLRDDPEDPKYIRTITGKGYRFIAPVTIEEAASPLAPAPPPAVPSALDALPSPPSREAVSSPEPRPASGRPTRVPATRAASGRGLRWTALAALTLVTVTGWSYLRRAQAPVPGKPKEGRSMLAVLPFENLTGDPGQEYFSDGFTEEMITRLSSLAPARLGVIARTSVMRYKSSPPSMDQIGRELGVQYALEGSVRRDVTRVRITAQLIKVEDQSHIWAQQFDRDGTDILRLQEEIAHAIARQIEMVLGEPVSHRRPASLSPKSHEAYEHYLRGRYYWNRRTAQDFQIAIEQFQKALAADPADARAHAGLADTWALMGTWRMAPPEEVLPRARDAAVRALQLDPSLAAAHTSLALINQSFDFDWAAAGDGFRRAIELDRNYATAHHWYAEHLGFLGRYEEALDEIAQARQLDPMSLIVQVDRAVILYYSRRYDEAVEAFRAVLSADPHFSRGYMIVLTLARQGQLDEAMAAVRKWQAFDETPWTGAYVAHLEGMRGRLDEARRALDEAERSNSRWNLDPLHLRLVAFAGMGLKEEAMEILQQACRRRSGFLVSLKVDPLLDSLREDPRFDELLRCARLGF